MISDPDWLKSALSAVFGAVSTAIAFIVRQDRRITRIEEQVKRVEASALKSAENGERIARLEGVVEDVKSSALRIEDKIDGFLVR